MKPGDLLVACRGGIGDHIISNGIVNRLTSEECDNRKVSLVCYSDWAYSLNYLYEDNPLVTVLPGKQPSLLGPQHEKYLKNLAAEMGLRYYSISTTNTDIRIYQQFTYQFCGVHFSYRFNNFKLPKRELYNEELIAKVKPNKPYALCHWWDKFSNRAIPNIRRELVTPGLEVIEMVPNLTQNLFDWLPIIYDAEEFHCVPGGPFHLIDTLIVMGKCKSKRNVYHQARMMTVFKPNNKYNKECWEYYGYPKKEAQ
jgi:hypothetical protein